MRTLERTNDWEQVKARSPQILAIAFAELVGGRLACSKKGELDDWHSTLTSLND